jgi:hypothetical protein
MERQPWMEQLKSRLVEGDNIVAEDEGSTLRDCVKSLSKVLCLAGYPGPRIDVRSESPDLTQEHPILAGCLDIDA